MSDIPTKEEILQMLLQAPSIRDSLIKSEQIIDIIRQVAGFAATHTGKRTILDRRNMTFGDFR